MSTFATEAGAVREGAAMLVPDPTRGAVPFDYAALEPAVADDARATAARIKGRLAGAVIENGRELVRIKERLGHGHFGPWLQAEFEMSTRTAENYMRAARFAEGKSAAVSNLPPAVIYALAAPSAPAQAVAEVVADFEAGKPPGSRTILHRLTVAKLAELHARPSAKRAASKEQLAKRAAAEKSRALRRERLEREEREREQLEREERARERQARDERLKLLATRVSERMGRDGAHELVDSVGDDFSDMVTFFRLLRQHTEAVLEE